MKKFIITVLILAVLGGGGYFAYQHFFADSDAADEDKVHVDSVADLMGEGAIGTDNIYTGVVEPQKEESVEKDDSNKINKVYVKEGDEVHEGDLLFDYDVEDIELQLEQANLEYESAEAQIETLKSSLEKLNAALEKASEDDKLSATLEVQETELEIKKEEYELVSKKSAITEIEKKLENSEVYSPIDGIIKSIKSDDDSYSYSSSDDSGYITIYSLGNYRVKGTVSEINRSNLHEGDILKVISRVDSTQTWTAVVTEISDQQDSTSSYYYGGDTSSKYTFYAELDSIDGLILGQHVYLSDGIDEEEEKEGIWIPSYYISEAEDGSSFVYSAKDGEKIQKVTVELGESDEYDDTVEIVSGLTKDDCLAFPSDDIAEGMTATTEAVAAAVSSDDTGDDYEGDYAGEAVG